jgi:hypothetical protein
MKVDKSWSPDGDKKLELNLNMCTAFLKIGS